MLDRLTFLIGIIHHVEDPPFEYDRADAVPDSHDRNIHERKLETRNSRIVIHYTEYTAICGR
jgi:hypothetical protein